MWGEGEGVRDPWPLPSEYSSTILEEKGGQVWPSYYF
jgi:hypothetical protein